MTKKVWGLVLLCFLIVMLYVGVCAGGFVKRRTDLEKELKEAEKKGYTVEISTKYNVEDSVEYSTMSVYSENRAIKTIHFDRWGNEQWHTLSEYYSDGRRSKDIDYNGKNEHSGSDIYEYDENGNMITKRSYSGEREEFIHHYQYDEQNRKISKAEDVGEGMTQAVFYTTSYFYDKVGRLSKEEIFANGKPYSYIVYEYDGIVLLKEEEYRIGEEKDSYQKGTEYEYDEEGRLKKSVYYDGAHNCSGYMTYGYY